MKKILTTILLTFLLTTISFADERADTHAKLTKCTASIMILATLAPENSKYQQTAIQAAIFLANVTDAYEAKYFPELTEDDKDRIAKEDLDTIYQEVKSLEGNLEALQKYWADNIEECKVLGVTTARELEKANAN